VKPDRSTAKPSLAILARTSDQRSFVYLALRQVDLSRMWLVIRTADPALFSLVILLNLFQYIIQPGAGAS